MDIEFIVTKNIPEKFILAIKFKIVNLTSFCGLINMFGDNLAFIAALDIGTTNIKCYIINSSTETVSSACTNVSLHYPKHGWVEIVPDELFKDITKTIREAVKNADIVFANIKSIGISTQRSTFTTWRKDTGETLHNFITWKDLRAVELLKSLNSSWPATFLRWAAGILYFFTRNKKFGMGNKFKVLSSHVTGRLLWVLYNIQSVQEALKTDNLMFGTLETWLLYKLTGGLTYVTDISNASATGFYDPFNMDWGIIAKLFKIPLNILPKVVNNNFDFGFISKELFGVPIRISCVMADQSASMFGSCCFKENDVKVTIGTGAFLDVNTSINIHPSLNGMYPLVGWKFDDNLVYMSEIPCSDAGSLIEWLQQAGFINNPMETFDMAKKVEDTDGTYFIPAFCGLGPPINNDNAATGFIGIKPTTTKEHMVRAVLESIVYRIVLAYKLLKKERNLNYKSIRVDGGLSNNDFLCQLLSDLTESPIERLVSSDLSVLGVAFVSGLSSEFWKSTNELRTLQKVETIFNPTHSEEKLDKLKNGLNNWLIAAERFKSWYQ